MNNKITATKWQENYNEGRDVCLSTPGWVAEKPNTQGFNGFYISWSKVWVWMVNNYPDFKSNVLEIGPNYITGDLWINGEKMGSTVLTLATFKQGGQETPEQLVNRVFVKLVAQYTGFGFHLWLEPHLHVSNNKPEKQYNKPSFERR